MCRRVEILTSAAPSAKIAPSTAISAPSEARSTSVAPAAGQPDDHQPGSRDRHADPLPPPETKAEEALGEHREEDEPAGEHRLHDRQRREREGTHVQPPREDRHDPADQEPLGAKQAGGAAHRVAGADRGCQDRAALLEQEGEVGGPAEPSARISPKITTFDPPGSPCAPSPLYDDAIADDFAVPASRSRASSNPPSRSRVSDASAR